MRRLRSARHVRPFSVSASITANSASITANSASITANSASSSGRRHPREGINPIERLSQWWLDSNRFGIGQPRAPPTVDRMRHCASHAFQLNQMGLASGFECALYVRFVD
jgi:hypothetical protein